MYFFTPLCKWTTSFLFSEMIISRVHQPCTNFFTLTPSKSNCGSCSLAPHKGMLKLKISPFFFITLYKNHLSTPKIFAVDLSLLMFSKTAILKNHLLCFHSISLQGPNPMIQTIKEVFNDSSPFDYLNRTC